MLRLALHLASMAATALALVLQAPPLEAVSLVLAASALLVEWIRSRTRR